MHLRLMWIAVQTGIMRPVRADEGARATKSARTRASEARPRKPAQPQKGAERRDAPDKTALNFMFSERSGRFFEPSDERSRGARGEKPH